MNYITDFFDRIADKILPRKMLVYLIYSMAAIYSLDLLLSLTGAGGISGHLVFFRDAILQGQIWRIFTFPFLPGLVASPYTIFSFLLNILLLYFASGLLLAKIGTRRTNGFLLLMWALLVIFGFFIGYSDYSMATWGIVILAALYSPEFQINLYFIIPIKGLLIAILGSAYLLWTGLFRSPDALMVLLAVVIYGWDEIMGYLGTKKRNIDFKAKVKDAQAVKRYRHKCSVCGVTDLDKPEMTFRYCSQCEGNFEYCEDHIKNHEHRTNVIDINSKLTK